MLFDTNETKKKRKQQLYPYSYLQAFLQHFQQRCIDTFRIYNDYV